VPRRTDWLLTLLAGDGSDPPIERLDPIRVMKGLYLAQNEVDTDTIRPLEDPAFVFVPYSYGPFTPSIYGELETLELLGFVESRQAPGRSFKTWRLTAEGEAESRAAVERLTTDEVARLRHAYRIVTTKGFNGLLEYVYSRYPDSASQSVHRAAR